MRLNLHQNSISKSHAWASILGMTLSIFLRRLFAFTTVLVLLTSAQVSISSAATLKYKYVGTGYVHSCGLTTDGRVFCWGSNDAGQLGNGKIGGLELLPTEVVGLKDVVQLHVGMGHSCAVRKSKDVLCWGYGAFGNLGNNSKENTGTPVQVQGLKDVASVSTGRFNSCAVTNSGDVYCWGSDVTSYKEVESGAPYEKENLTAAKLTGFNNISSISIGSFHMCALTRSGDVICLGRNDVGQIPGGTSTLLTTPQQVSVDKSKKLSAGSAHTCALTLSNEVICWGYGKSGQTGAADKPDVTTPSKIAGLSKVSDISSGRFYSCAITSENKVLCWGNNAYGQLGNGSTVDSSTPVEAIGLVSPVALGYMSVYSSHSCVVTKVGEFQCWGFGEWGQLGTGDKNTRSTPATPTSSTKNSIEAPSSDVDLKKTITCKKGAVEKQVSGKAPKCPSGFQEVAPKKPKPVFYLDMKVGCYAGNFPVSSQLIHKRSDYKTLYPVKCSDKYHYEVIFSGQIKTASPSLPTQKEAGDKCSIEYKRVMGREAPREVQDNATYLIWYFPDAGVEAKKFPRKLICVLMKTDISYTYVAAQTRPLSGKSA